uniref:Uncharacterized protein n=1 Tax=Florenciella parvula TaxID=236787 RepID=A0A7S2G008_9STRA|mmetsp:Transcript_28736/g.58884  ORF Transcript_28736/g.58884 Transcript_28736/m.58884 type:complete len:141 (+) Transcript_28736:401-823(+)
MCTKLGALLEAADAASPPTALTFVIVVAASSSMRRGTAWHALTQTPYRRAMLEIPLQQHGYMAGHQHIEKEATRMSSCDTACLFWQNNTATGDARSSLVPFPPSLEADIRATFRSAVPYMNKKKKKSTGGGEKSGKGGRR